MGGRESGMLIIVSNINACLHCWKDVLWFTIVYKIPLSYSYGSNAMLGSTWFCLWFVVFSVNLNSSHRKNSVHCELNITVCLTDWLMWNISLFLSRRGSDLFFIWIFVTISSMLSDWIWHLLRLRVTLIRPCFLLCLLEVRT